MIHRYSLQTVKNRRQKYDRWVRKYMVISIHTKIRLKLNLYSALFANFWTQIYEMNSELKIQDFFLCWWMHFIVEICDAGG